jgi:hypothetical protein
MNFVVPNRIIDRIKGIRPSSVQEVPAQRVGKPKPPPKFTACTGHTRALLTRPIHDSTINTVPTGPMSHVGSCCTKASRVAECGLGCLGCTGRPNADTSLPHGLSRPYSSTIVHEQSVRQTSHSTFVYSVAFRRSSAST